MRAAIYARVSMKYSSDSISDRKQETENQLIQLRQFARTQDWIIVSEFVDRKTGKNADREQFQAMFESASRREFDILLFWSLDRLSREGTVETLNHLQRLNSYGVQYRSFTEQYLDSTGVFKEAVIGILAAVAKQERIRIGERVLAGHQRARAQGKRIGRPPVVDDKPRLALEIQKMREEGMSFRLIAKTTGISVNTVRSILCVDSM